MPANESDTGATDVARAERGGANFDHLTLHAREAREALASVMPPTPENDNPLYYPLLFLTETVEQTLRDVLRSAFEDMREENEGAARFLAEARQAIATPPLADPA